MFVLSFKNGDDDPTRDSFGLYEIYTSRNQWFYALIDNKPFFDQAGKTKQEAYENPVEMSGNDD